jgi:hypothetical protein
MRFPKSIAVVFGKTLWKKSANLSSHSSSTAKEVMNVKRNVSVEGGIDVVEVEVPVSKCSDDGMEESFRPASENQASNTLCSFCSTVDFKVLFTESPLRKLPDANATWNATLAGAR